MKYLLQFRFPVTKYWIIKTLIKMRQPFLFATVISILAISCNNQSQQNAAKDNATDTSRPIENKVMIPASTCYESISKKDTVRLKVEVFAHVVTGMLSYHLYEKDKNDGDIEAQFKGDTLVADYSFMSEGKRSVRQVAFLIKDSTAIEGYGDMEEKDGKMVFKDLNKLDFGKGIILKKGACDY